MLIRKDKKALIFKLREPSRITSVITTAKIVQHKGFPLVAVPHRPEEVRVLRNLGFEDIPDPMPFYYDFPGGFRPFDNQIKSSSFAAMNDRCYILNGMGTGKTITSLWAADYLKSAKQINRILVTCPLSTMEETWAKAVFRTFPERQVAVLYGSKERRLKLLEQPADIYIINHHGLQAIQHALAKRPDIDLIIVDELAVFRNASTDLWKCLNTICNKQSTRKVWGLTGAPIPHAPTDSWAQCRIVMPNNPDLPSSFTKFRERTMRPAGPYKWVAKEDALQTVHSIMQPAIRFSLDDCIDLPPQIFVSRTVPMTKEQDDAYKAMLRKLKAEYLGGEVKAVNEGVKLTKLLQIALGTAYGTDGQRITLPSQPRLDVLKEIIEESEGKVIVFVPLTGALETVAAEIRKEWDTEIVFGGTSKTDRDRIFDSFQNTAYPHVLIANPGTMSHGLTLTTATTIVWYGPCGSNDTYVQACERVRRPGQTRSTLIAHLVGSPVEERMFERLKGKQKMQGVLLDMFADAEG